MVDTQYLEKRIEESGLKINYLCEKLGITRQALWKKMNNKAGFKANEAIILCDVLKIPKNIRFDVFFYQTSCLNENKQTNIDGRRNKYGKKIRNK